MKLFVFEVRASTSLCVCESVSVCVCVFGIFCLLARFFECECLTESISSKSALIIIGPKLSVPVKPFVNVDPQHT